MRVILLCYTLCIIPALNSGQSHSYFFRPGPGPTQQQNLQAFEQFPQQQFNSPQSNLFNNNFGLLTQQIRQSQLGQVQQQQQTPYSGVEGLNHQRVDNGSPFQGPPLGNLQQYIPARQQYQQQFLPDQQPQQLQPNLQEFHSLYQHQQLHQQLQQFQPQGLQQLQPHGQQQFHPVQQQQQLQQPELQQIQPIQDEQQPPQELQQQPQELQQQPHELQKLQPQGQQQFQHVQQAQPMQQPELHQIQPIQQVQQPLELQQQPQKLQQQPQELQQQPQKLQQQPQGIQQQPQELQQQPQRLQQLRHFQHAQQGQEPELQQIQPIQQQQLQPQELQQLQPQGLQQFQHVQYRPEFQSFLPAQQAAQLQQPKFQQFEPLHPSQYPRYPDQQQLQPIQIQQPHQLEKAELQAFQGVQPAQQSQLLEPLQPLPVQQAEEQPEQQQLLSVEQQQQPEDSPLLSAQPQQLQQFTTVQQAQLLQPRTLQHFRHGQSYPFLHVQQQQNFLPTHQTEQVQPLVLKHFRLADQQQQPEGIPDPEIGALQLDSTQPSLSPPTISSEGALMTSSHVTPTLESQVQPSEVESPAIVHSTAKEQNSKKEEDIIPNISTEVPLNVSPSDQTPASTATTPSVSQQGRSQRTIERRGQQSRRRSNRLTASTAQIPPGVNSDEVHPTTYKSKFVYVPRTTVRPLSRTSTLGDPPVTPGSTESNPQEELPATTYKSKFIYAPTTSRPASRFSSTPTAMVNASVTSDPEPQEPELSTIKSKFKFVPKESVQMRVAEGNDGRSKPKVNISRALTLQRIIMFRASASEMKKVSSTTKRPVNISRRPLLRSRPKTERKTEDVQE